MPCDSKPRRPKPHGSMLHRSRPHDSEPHGSTSSGQTPRGPAPPRNTAAACRGTLRYSQPPRLAPQAPQYISYSSIGGQAQIRFRSPAALSTSPTAGQNLWTLVQGAG